MVTLAQIPMPIKIGTTFQNKLHPSGEVGEEGRGQVGGGGPPASTTITVLPILPSGGGNSGRFRNVAKKGCRVTKVETH